MWYSSGEATRFAEEHGTELNELLTPRLIRASDGVIEELEKGFVDTVSPERGELKESDVVEEILRENINDKNISEEFADTEFNWHDVKSHLYREISIISRRARERQLELFEREDLFISCIEELESDSFKSRYREELVSTIKEYLKTGTSKEEVEIVTTELIGELSSAGWGEDSFDEVIEILGDKDDIEEFCQVISGKLYELNYCVPLPVDKLPRDHVQIAGVDFYMKGSLSFQFLSDLMTDVIDADAQIPPIFDVLRNDTNMFAVLSVNAPTSAVGEQRMEIKLERAIDALNFGQKRGVIQSPFMQRQTKYICQYPDGSYDARIDIHEKYDYPLNWNLDEDDFDKRVSWFDFLDNPVEELSELERRLIRSYRWYGDALQSGIPEEELLKYVISMENMLVPEVHSGKKRDLLAERLANLRGIYADSRQGFKDQVVALYQIRNELVHGAEIDIQGLEGDVKTAHRLASQMFALLFAEEVNKYRKTENLLRDLEEREIPERPEGENPFRVG